MNNLTELTSTAVRDSLVSSLPIDDGGGTSIGGGIYSAIQVGDIAMLNTNSRQKLLLKEAYIKKNPKSSLFSRIRIIPKKKNYKQLIVTLTYFI